MLSIVIIAMQRWMFRVLRAFVEDIRFGPEPAVESDRVSESDMPTAAE